MSFVRASVILGVMLVALGGRAGAAEQPAETRPAPAAKAAAEAAAAPVAAADAVVATVNGVGIGRAEFERNMQYLLQNSRIPAGHAENSEQMSEIRGQVRDRMIDEELLYQEAKRRNLVAAKEAVDAEFERARAQFPSPEAFAQGLSQNQLSEEGLRELLSRNLSIQALVEKDITAAVTVTDAEVHEFYAGNREKFEAPEQVHARHILVEVDEKADEAARQAARTKADGLLAQLKGGAGFEELARANSDCPSAAQGGDLGFFTHGQMVPAFDQAAFALKPGELSGVVETPFGYHLIRCEEKKPAGLVPEQEVGESIREHLVSVKSRAALEARLKALHEAAKIELQAL